MGFDEDCVLQWETQVICLASKISPSVFVKFYQQEIAHVNSNTEIGRFQFSFQYFYTTSTYITLWHQVIEAETMRQNGAGEKDEFCTWYNLLVTMATRENVAHTTCSLSQDGVSVWYTSVGYHGNM